MKHFVLTAFTALTVAFSTAVFAQTAMTSCEQGEGQVLEYDFGRNLEGQFSLETLSPLRLAASNCVSGQPSKTTFRGVNAEFENRTQVQQAIGAAQVLVSLGISEPAALGQLIERVKTGLRQVEEQRPGTTHKVSIYVIENESGKR